VKYVDWDESTTQRAAKMVAEGGTFPESKAAWIEKSIDLKKVGDSIPVSEEMLVDHARFAGELEGFLQTNVALIEDDQLLNGDGSGTNIKGLKASAVSYTATTEGIQDASLYDLVPKVCESIVFGKGSKFQPNVVIMNLKEINKYKLKKDANNNYIMPPFVGNNGQMIDGLTVVENNNVDNNVCYVGDSRYGTIYEGAEGYSVTLGMVDNQFMQDMKTIKARKRMALLIKDSEATAWRKVSSISNALVTLATS
jgi:HK97 family phage major capsid protein